jgi:hypothetical protein
LTEFTLCSGGRGSLIAAAPGSEASVPRSSWRWVAGRVRASGNASSFSRQVLVIIVRSVAISSASRAAWTNAVMRLS